MSLSIEELIKELIEKINKSLSLYFLKTEGKTEIIVEEKRVEEKAYESPCDRELSEFRNKCVEVNGGVITYEAYESLKTKANTIIHYDRNICGTRYLCVSYVYETEYKPEKTGVVIEEKPKTEEKVETKTEEKVPCHLRGEGVPWNWISEGIDGYVECVDQILGPFPDVRLMCGVMVYLMKNNMIHDYKCHRYCVYCNDICYGWGNDLLSGQKINGYCDNQGNCYIEGGIKVYPIAKEDIELIEQKASSSDRAKLRRICGV
jgi:hypothetical protein